MNPTAVIENNNINVCISISNPLSKRVIAFQKKYGPIQDYCYCYSRVIGLMSLLALYMREHQRLTSFHDKISLVSTSSCGNRLIMNLDYHIPFKN